MDTHVHKHRARGLLRSSLCKSWICSARTELWWLWPEQESRSKTRGLSLFSPRKLSETTGTHILNIIYMYEMMVKPWARSHLPPVRPSRLGSGPQASDGISLLLLSQKIQRHLQADGLHVVLAERWRHVHVHLQEATWQTAAGSKSGSPPALNVSAPPHLLAPRQPDPSPVLSANWRTTRMTSGLCWSRWSRPAGFKSFVSTSARTPAR